MRRYDIDVWHEIKERFNEKLSNAEGKLSTSFMNKYFNEDQKDKLLTYIFLKSEDSEWVNINFMRIIEDFFNALTKTNENELCSMEKEYLIKNGRRIVKWKLSDLEKEVKVNKKSVEEISNTPFAFEIKSNNYEGIEKVIDEQKEGETKLQQKLNDKGWSIVGAKEQGRYPVGIHLHYGFKDIEKRINVAKALRPLMPELLILTSENKRGVYRSFRLAKRFNPFYVSMDFDKSVDLFKLTYKQQKRNFGYNLVTLSHHGTLELRFIDSDSSLSNQEPYLLVLDAIVKSIADNPPLIQTDGTVRVIKRFEDANNIKENYFSKYPGQKVVIEDLLHKMKGNGIPPEYLLKSEQKLFRNH